jgi:hypothetical protein
MVFFVSFGAAVGVIVLFALGVTALAMPNSASGPAPSQTRANVSRSPWAWPVAMLCFVACAFVVAYGLCLIIAK